MATNNYFPYGVLVFILAYGAQCGLPNLSSALIDIIKGTNLVYLSCKKCEKWNTFKCQIEQQLGSKPLDNIVSIFLITKKIWLILILLC